MDSSAGSQSLTHDDRASILIGVVCLVCTIATTAVGLRFYTRSCILKQLGIDDYLILAALAFALATGVSQCTNTRNGLGKHVWNLGSDIQRSNYLKGFYVSITLYNTGLMFVKLAFLTQYYRLLATKKMRMILMIAMVLIGCWSMSQIAVGIFICDPISGFWENSTGSCIGNYPQWYINAAGNIATDIAIFVLPLPVLRHLHLPKAQRLVLIGIFSFGFFTCAISVIRIKFLQLGGDVSYENVEGSSWSITELCSGITCACLPTLRPLVSKWIPALSNRLHKPTRNSCMAGAERGSRHIRGDSDASRMMDMKNEDEIFYYLGVHARSDGNMDGSNDSLEAGRLRESLSTCHGGSSPTPPPPPCAHIQTRTSHRPSAYCGWIGSSVTTEIGTGEKRNQHNPNNLSAAAIQVQRDVVMH
ncbi:uncharacterized protein F4812DRAFT_344533 [Daldinia caldariorum]|uniref:uncharacterized protein n=1 Tax=Daldinia caldariorum TaxID=326644 RepID=UPI002008BCE9|nr:uncharacterized protein F4812DRAFT_344533 [Daldinia caldariorum]KAI1468734.1 hypothetical protein F4812DRAFT_344533 [Daldinia caldariorum]